MLGEIVGIPQLKAGELKGLVVGFHLQRLAADENFVGVGHSAGNPRRGQGQGPDNSTSGFDPWHLD